MLDIALRYDASGELTSDGVNSYAWNAEALMASANSVNYTYDGDRKRVEKSNGTLYWYDPSGNILEETDLSGNLLHDYIYFGGKRIARQDGSGASTAYYYFQDHLGTGLMMVDGWGHVQQQSVYYPFGGERVITNNVANNYKFTGLERDSESGLDHTLNRQYSSNLGRWLSPDRLGGRVISPQSLNLYSYVLNNACSATDPLGLDDVPIDLPVVFYATGSAPFPYDFFGDPSDEAVGGLLVRMGGGRGGGGVGSYGSFDRQWGGTFPCNKTAAQVASYVETNFATLASTVVPAYGSENVVTFSAPRGITAGASVWASVATMVNTSVFHVPIAQAQLTVLSAGATGFVLTPNAAVSPLQGTLGFFFAQQGAGQISFAISAHADFTSPLARFLSRAGQIIESGIWNNLIDEVKSYCKEK
jgi:RHS repeat-associated protein